MLRLALKVVFGVKVWLLEQLTLLNTEADVSVTVNTRVQKRNSFKLFLDLVIMILLCCKISALTETKK